ncbi:hypothetical protein D3C81_2002590 [compost metagenome]
MQDRHIFSITPGYPIQSTEFTDAVSGQHNTGPVNSGIAISRVGRIQLIGTSYPAQTRVSDDAVEELQIVITWHTKHMVNTAFSQTIDQIICDCVIRLHRHLPFAA